MAAGIYSFKAQQGETFSRVLTWKDSAGNPINLTGYTARMQLRSSATSSTVILELTTNSGITLGGAAGTITLTISATTMAGLTPGAYSYDLEMVSGSGVVTPLLKGVFTIAPEVTR